MNETKVLLPPPPHHKSNAMRKHKSASSLGGSLNRAVQQGYKPKEAQTSNRAYPLNSLPLPPQIVESQPPSDHDECEPMILSTSSSSVLTTTSSGASEATTLYSDHPLDKEQRWREDRERPTVHIVGPLPHQCAGHETVFRTTDGKICKPLDETEFWFYKICLREFPHYKPYVPAWHGCVLLSRKKLLLLIDSLADEEDDSSSASEGEEMEVQRGAFEVAPHHHDTLRGRLGSPSSPGTWSLLLSEEFRLKLELEDNVPSAPSRVGPRSYPYIVLEDLTAGYDFPCTLDIKMGTKDLHHQISTSTTLGLRIMGMQVYEPSTHTYRQFDKMQGRQLINETVPDQLAQFVTQTANGVPVIRREVLLVFIEKLKALLAILRRETTVQIQNSSLLLVYEGRVRSSGSATPGVPVKADVRMIDFQHVELSSTNPELRSPTVLSPPTTRRKSSAAFSSGDDDSIGDDSEDGDGLAAHAHAHAAPETDNEGLVWGFTNLISLLEAALSRPSSS